MLEILIVGAVSSAIYAMLAVGFTLIFGVARVLNLAHGSFYALGAYGAYFFTAHLKLPLLPAALLAVALVAVFGVVIERVLIRPMRKSQLAVLMITLAVALVIEQTLFLTFGSEYRNVPAFVDRMIPIGGVDVGGARLLALGVGSVLIGALWLFIQHTRLGSAILAVSQDPQAAQYMGIPSNRIFSVALHILRLSQNKEGNRPVRKNAESRRAMLLVAQIKRRAPPLRKPGITLSSSLVMTWPVLACWRCDAISSTSSMNTTAWSTSSS